MSPLIIAVVALAVLGIAIAYAASGRITPALKRLAAERNGSVRKPFGAYPVLSVPHEGVEVIASATSGGDRGHRHSYAHFYLGSFPESLFFGIVTTGGVRPQRQPFAGYATVRTGERAFDDRFRVHARDGAFVRALLTPEIRRRLLELRADHVVDARLGDAAFHEDGAWSERPRFSIEIRGVSTEYLDYRRLVDAAVGFHARIRELRSGPAPASAVES